MGEGLASELIRSRIGPGGTISWGIFTPEGVRLADRFKGREEAERALQELLCSGASHRRSRSKLTPATSISGVLARYLRDEALNHRGAETDKIRIDRFRELPLARRPYASLCLQDMYLFLKERRSQGVSDPTILRELQIWKQLVKYARRHGLKPFEDPFTGLPRLRNSPPKYRELTAEEQARVHRSLCALKNPEICEIYRFLEASGMRLGATMEMRWQDIDLGRGTCVLPLAKTGEKNQIIALTPEAVAILAARTGDAATERVWTTSRNAFRVATSRIFKRVGVAGFRRHDLRHKCITRLVRDGRLSEIEIMKVSGHTDRRSLARYTHLRAEDVAQKMRNDWAVSGPL